MRAYVIHAPGGPDALQLETTPDPAPKEGWVLIDVRAFGLNRSEWFTRRGDSPSVRFPRVLGIECTGEVLDAGGTDLVPGTRVAALMGGMGREFDGSYAEKTLVPRDSVFALPNDLPWSHFAALPEMLQTTHGSLHKGLEARAGETLLIRGGTSSVGLATLALAKDADMTVISTTRSLEKEDMLRAAGADDVIVDTGEIAGEIRRRAPGGVDRVLELIGATTLLDSLRCTRRGGVVCMTGILGGSWTLDQFHPMGDIPTAVKLTSYAGDAGDITADLLSSYIQKVQSGSLSIPRGPVFRFDELREAHTLMDDNKANGKIVVTLETP
ncbi:zinc-binding alcohol dehydrogenase family protein [Engelhardtia mirabilis]|uniref:Acrylyl-CoA reductase AcuI n=1 Tax=Engelhardtia mirabilis TaxID=2528011 RepID=A0A518BM53_9BACT|nr:Acrylyl-CoA reductase AcuI [Planctomycetes bacterium Pla133]QDV02391.1 Acrylyl-CoA reductase AcuI [Planctomycetes bacterium Pla86]